LTRIPRKAEVKTFFPPDLSSFCVAVETRSFVHSQACCQAVSMDTCRGVSSTPARCNLTTLQRHTIYFESATFGLRFRGPDNLCLKAHPRVRFLTLTCHAQSHVPRCCVLRLVLIDLRTCSIRSWARCRLGCRVTSLAQEPVKWRSL
jgi:hypothetical protein